MSKDLEDFYKQYSSRITEIDDTPLFATGTFGEFRMLTIEEYEKLVNENKILAKALELAVADKCKFENALLSTSLGITNGEVAVPKKEQWYLEQAEKEMANG